MSLRPFAPTRLGIWVALAVLAAAGVLLIENDTARLLYLVGICVLMFTISHLIGESESTRGPEGAGFYVPVVGAIALSTLVFEDEQRQFASMIVLVLLFRVAWVATQAARSGRPA